jgi:hypothetical protein
MAEVVVTYTDEAGAEATFTKSDLTIPAADAYAAAVVRDGFRVDGGETAKYYPASAVKVASATL